MQKQEIIPCFLGCCFIVSILYLFYNEVLKKESLTKNLEYTKAVVFDFSMMKGRRYVHYEFFITGERYDGSSRYHSKVNELFVGDTIYIMYDRTDPENNKKFWYD